jgi:hypothetical protein
VLFVVDLRGLFSMTSRMDRMRPCYMGMVRRFLVLSALVMFCCFTMMAGGVGKVFLCFLVMFGSFFRHYIPPGSITAIVFFGARICPPKLSRQRNREAQQAERKYRGERCYQRHGAKKLSRPFVTAR